MHVSHLLKKKVPCAVFPRFLLLGSNIVLTHPEFRGLAYLSRGQCLICLGVGKCDLYYCFFISSLPNIHTQLLN